MRHEVYDGPTEQALKYQGVVKEVSEDRGGVLYRSFAQPIEFYYRRKLINHHQRAAARKLYAVWWYGAGASSYVQARYTDTNGGGFALNFTPPGLCAAEYREAVNSIRGVLARDVTHDVCCEGYAAGKGRMDYLREGLDDLITFFDIRD